jgi:hypothetical protein
MLISAGTNRKKSKWEWLVRRRNTLTNLSFFSKILKQNGHSNRSKKLSLCFFMWSSRWPFCVYDRPQTVQEALIRPKNVFLMI